ncbi:hypothetical protein Drorol1_Dr00020732 [Drosera rotundifolia]
MAFSRSSSKLPIFLALASYLFIQETIGELVCEVLPKEICAFAIASSGKRCVLEYHVKERGKREYECRTTDVMVESMSEYIEDDECVEVCGVERNMVGISSDALLDSRFIGNLCSRVCSQNCPNIIDLYFNLAHGEGVFLPELCEKQRSNPERAMVEVMSSGTVTVLVSEEKTMLDAPAPPPA